MREKRTPGPGGVRLDRGDLLQVVATARRKIPPMTDHWLATCAVKLMLHTPLRLTQATAIAMRLGERFGASNPEDAVTSAFESGLIRFDDLPSVHQTSRSRPQEPMTTDRRRSH